MGRKFFPEKFTISMFLTMMYYKRGQMVPSFLADKPTTSPLQGTSEILHLKIIRWDLKAFLGDIKTQQHSLNKIPLGFASTRAA